MKLVAKELYGWASVILHFVAIPIFAFVFIQLYTPLGLHDYLAMENAGADFNLIMLCCILLGVLVGMRLALHFLRNVMHLNTVLYALWCVGEILIFSAFAGLYLSLMSHGDWRFYDALVRSFFYGIAVLIYPYLVLGLGFTAYGYATAEPVTAGEASILKFRDNRQVLKLAVSAEALLYVEAAANYIIIYYMDGEKVKKFTLRSSLKKVEEMLSANSIIRSHRTYFVNPAKVRLLRRDPDGSIYAEMDCPGNPKIPVSKTYYDRLSAIL